MAEVTLSPEAIGDLVEIYHYIAERDGEEQAEAVLNRLEQKAQSLARFPLRGKLPEELIPFGNDKIREVQEHPWRIFYYEEMGNVVVLNFLDGRRVLNGLLEQRLVQ